MSIAYTYEIIKVDAQARVMEIVYSAQGHQTMHIGARLPYAGESVDAVVNMYAPVRFWEEQQAEIVVPALGAGVFTPDDGTPKTVQAAKEMKLAELSAWRYSLETAGINVNGAAVRTDRESQAALTSAYVSLSNGLLTSVDWKTSNGAWVALTLAEIAPIAKAVAEHVQRAFTDEKMYADIIQSKSTIDEVLAVVFPA